MVNSCTGKVTGRLGACRRDLLEAKQSERTQERQAERRVRVCGERLKGEERGNAQRIFFGGRAELELGRFFFNKLQRPCPTVLSYPRTTRKSRSAPPPAIVLIVAPRA